MRRAKHHRGRVSLASRQSMDAGVDLEHVTRNALAKYRRVCAQARGSPRNFSLAFLLSLSNPSPQTTWQCGTVDYCTTINCIRIHRPNRCCSSIALDYEIHRLHSPTTTPTPSAVQGCGVELARRAAQIQRYAAAKSGERCTITSPDRRRSLLLSEPMV